MSRSWAGWLAFAVLATTIGMTSCNALYGPALNPARAQSGPVATDGGAG